MSNREPILEAKRRLPLPKLMQKLGLGEHTKKSARCPFHEDGSNSFSVFQDKSTGAWAFNCFAGCGGGDEIRFLEKRNNLPSGGGVHPYLEMAGVRQVDAAKSQPNKPRINWQKCLADFKPKHAQKLASDRAYSIEFVTWLHEQGLVGLHKGKVAFPVHAVRGPWLPAISSQGPPTGRIGCVNRRVSTSVL